VRGGGGDVSLFAYLHNPHPAGDQGERPGTSEERGGERKKKKEKRNQASLVCGVRRRGEKKGKHGGTLYFDMTLFW